MIKNKWEYYLKFYLLQIKKIILIWDFKLIRSKLISKYNNVSHGFFNKLGGYSNGIYRSLNCGTGSKDKKKKY